LGSIKFIEKSKLGGFSPGEIKASLNEKLKSVKWGEYKLDDLFEKIKTNSLKYKTADLPSKATGEFTLPALTAGIQNQGLNNYVPVKNATILKNVISISANGANTGATFYQNKEFTVLQDAYAIRWKYDSKSLTDNQFLFLTSCISKAIFGNYEWTNKAGWEKIKNDTIKLPIKNNKIDFDFMESFIAELNAYLSVSGLDNYELSDKEKSALADFESLEWKDFKLTEILTPKNTRSILSSSIIEESGTTPYLCASAENNSVSSYIDYDKNMLDEGNCIFIGGKTFVISYQKEDFYSNDSHNLALYLINKKYREKLPQLYIATCIYKSLNHKYSWGDSISKQKIQSDFVTLPTKENQPNFKIMETFISAVEKLVIKDVVMYADRKIKATKDVINE